MNPTFTGSIAGTIFNDDNVNGIRDAAEKQSSVDGKARVIFISIDGSGIQKAGDPYVYDNVADGSFKFSNLPDGTYALTRVFPPLYRLSNPTNVGGSVRRVTVSGGNAVTGVDLGTTNRPAISSTPTPPVSTTATTPDSGSVPDQVIDTKPAALPAVPVHPFVKGACAILDLGISTKLTTDIGQETVQNYGIRLGISGTREWVDLSGHETGYASYATKFAALLVLAKLGFKIVLACAYEHWSNNMPSVASTRTAVTALIRQLQASGLTPDMVQLESGNEPNLSQYWPWSMQQWVDNFANPFYDVAHAAGYTVISGAVTGSIDWLHAALAYGLKCDIVGFHPYRLTAADLQVMIAELVAITKLPIVFTEWNIFVGPNYRAWLVLQQHPDINAKLPNAQLLPLIQKIDPKAALPAIAPDDIKSRMLGSWQYVKAQPQIVGCYYFTWKDQGTTTGPLALISSNKPTTFAQTVKSFAA